MVSAPCFFAAAATAAISVMVSRGFAGLSISIAYRRGRIVCRLLFKYIIGSGCYMLGKDGRLKALTCFSKREREENAVHRLRKNMRATWMPSQNKMLTVGGMAFQDNSNIDLMRVQRCSIQIIQRDGRLIPLCSKYLSSCDGHKIFDGIG